MEKDMGLFDQSGTQTNFMGQAAPQAPNQNLSQGMANPDNPDGTRNLMADYFNRYGNDTVSTMPMTPNFNVQGQTTPTQNPYGTNPYINSTNPYIQAANATASGNITAANAATAANRVNQNTPYGSLQYQQTGVDANGNPIWSANQTLAPQFQNTFNSLTNQAAQNYARPFNGSAYQQQMVGQGPQFQGVGSAPQLQTGVQGTGMQGWDTATNLLMSRLDPQIAHQNEMSDQALANQGIMPGSQAYENAKRVLGQQQNDLRVQAQLAGSQLQNQMFNQNLASGTFGNTALQNQNTMNLGNTQFNNQLGQQGFVNQLAGTAANNAATQANLTNALNQYQMPMQGLANLKAITSPNYVNPYNQAAVAAPDYLGAYSTANAADIAKANAEMARQTNLTNGLLGLGSSALLGGTGKGSALGSIGGGLSDLYKYFNSLNPAIASGQNPAFNAMTGLTGNESTNLDYFNANPTDLSYLNSF
jgi:hypothetical protein